MLKHALLVAFALSSFAWAGPEDENPISIAMVNPVTLVDALEKDYRAFLRSRQVFPHHPAVGYLLRLEPAAAPEALVAAAESWLLALYPSIEHRPIDELQDGLTDPKGAPPREKLLRWLLNARLTDVRRQHLAVTVLSRESDRECRNAVFESLNPELLKGQDFGIAEGLFKVVETDSVSIAEAEKFLAVRALVNLAARLPASRIAETHRRLKQIAGDQSSNVSEEIVRALGASLVRTDRIAFIHEVLTSGRYPSLAKIGAVALVHNDIRTSGQLHPTLEAALRLSATADPDEVTAEEVRTLLASHSPTVGDDDCSAKVARLRRRHPPRT